MGYCVDFTAHMMRTYVSSKGKTRYHKTQDALGEFGFAILQSGVAALMAVLCLGSSYTYILRVAFRFFFIGIGLSIFHTLLIFPVFLYHLGPLPYHKEDKTKKRRVKLKEKRIDEDPEEIRKMAKDIMALNDFKDFKDQKMRKYLKKDYEDVEENDSVKTVATIAPAVQTFQPDLNTIPKLDEFVSNESSQHSNDPTKVIVPLHRRQTGGSYEYV